MIRRTLQFPYPLAAALLLAVSGCSQGYESMTTQAPSFDNPTHAQFVAAVRDGDDTLARELLSNGANVNATDSKGTPVLNWLIRQNDRAAVRLLLELGADPTQTDAAGRTALHEAARARNPGWIDLLLKHGVAVDVPNSRNGQTALYDALLAREQDNVDRLLAAGAKLDVRDQSGITPLLQAVMVNDIPTARRFIEAGADPFVVDDNGGRVASYLYDGDPALLLAPVRKDHAWIRARLEQQNVN